MMAILEIPETILIDICSLSYFAGLFPAASFYDMNALLNQRLAT